jgi:hypothetical protein
MGGCFL